MARLLPDSNMCPSSSLPHIPMMVLGGLTFVVAALAVRAITIDEILEMRSIIRPRSVDEDAVA